MGTRPRFGTDGLRGVANTELSPELVLALGRAAARVLGGGTWYAARDTRRSGVMLQAALCAGLASEGAEVLDLGVLPTPGVAYLSAADGVPGAMISASHNPFGDNGVKLFGPGGRKLVDAAEAAIEAELDIVLAAGADGGSGGGAGARRRSGAVVGTLRPAPAEATERYLHHLVSSLEGRSLDGLRVVVDCAHGAASTIGPLAFERLGARVDVMGHRPDGANINDGCGSTQLDALRAAVVAHQADAGVAFDGDADRCLAVDHTARVVDGDHMMAICATDLQARGLLPDHTVVVTVMTNLGFRHAMAAAGITVRTTPVGDRYVLEDLDAGGYGLGGEQSGHLIFRRLASTGDGVLTGLAVLDVVARSGRTLADLAGAAMTRLPQVLQNVVVANGSVQAALATADPLWAEVRAVEAELGDEGRVLLRPSGTEPLVRVMVEAATAEQAEALAARVTRAAERCLSAPDPHGGDQLRG